MLRKRSRPCRACGAKGPNGRFAASRQMARASTYWPAGLVRTHYVGYNISSQGLVGLWRSTSPVPDGPVRVRVKFAGWSDASRAGVVFAMGVSLAVHSPVAHNRRVVVVVMIRRTKGASSRVVRTVEGYLITDGQQSLRLDGDGKAYGGSHQNRYRVRAGTKGFDSGSGTSGRRSSWQT
jgi:hypothetical protein